VAGTTPKGGPMNPILQLEGVDKRFGGLAAVQDCSFAVRTGSITGLIGPNGAGKTTLFNLVSGTLSPDGGDIRYEGRPIRGLSPDAVARRGLVRTFQMPRPFARLTVWENLMFAAPDQPGERLWQSWRPRLWRAREAELAGQAHRILTRMQLSSLADAYAGTLSGGQRKLLELARLLMMNPRLILLDEPLAGVNPTLTGLVAGQIESLNQQGITFLMIEHNLNLVMRLCHRVVVMHQGRLLAEGPPETIRRDPRVVEAYLGGTIQ
jgi:ABC-type branched-subunit amino acid transport system ATPase component